MSNIVRAISFLRSFNGAHDDMAEAIEHLQEKNAELRRIHGESQLHPNCTTEQKALANLLDAVEGVLWFSWADGDIDDDAARAIDRLRLARNDYGTVQRLNDGSPESRTELKP